MKRLLSILSVGAFLALSMGGSAFAGSATANITVQGTLGAACLIAITSQPAAFVLVPGSQPAQNTGTLGVNCTATSSAGDTFTVALGVGLNGTGSGTATPTRALANGAYTGEGYQIYSNVGDTTVWGDDVGTNTIAGRGLGMGSGDQVAFTFYVLPASVSNEAPTGSYSDTVVATVAY